MGWRFVLRQQAVLKAQRRREAKWNLPKPIKKWRIVKGDKVQIIEGVGKGEQGVVKEVIRKLNKVVIEGLRMRRYIIPANAMEPRKTKFIEVPIHVTNVMLVDPETNEPTKVGRIRHADGHRVRVARSGAILEKPIPPARERVVNNVTDTPASVALRKTYVPPNYDVIIPRVAAARAKKQAEKEAKAAAQAAAV